MSRKQSSNPFYALVVAIGVAFVLTSLSYVVVLVKEQRRGSQELTRRSPVQRFFERRGESLLLWETGALTLAALMAMGLDRWRSWRDSPNSPQP